MQTAERQQFLERSLDNFFDLFDRHKLREQFHDFCGHLGYSAVSGYLMDEANFQILLPENGVLDITQDSPDKIPVTAMQHGESLEIVSVFHPLQTRGNSTQINTEKSSCDVALPEGRDAIASVWTHPKFTDVGFQPVTIYERLHPVFIANADPEDVKHGLMCPTTVAHEFMHLAQALNNPYTFLSKDNVDYELALNTLSHEIEAYAYQDGLYDPLMFDLERVTSISMAATIEAIRRVTLRDSYKADEVFVEKANKDVFAKRILPKALREPTAA